MNGDVVWFRSELDNQTKWKNENIRETLPADLVNKLEKIDEEDRDQENDLVVPNAATIAKLEKMLGEEQTKKFV